MFKYLYTFILFLLPIYALGENSAPQPKSVKLTSKMFRMAGDITVIAEHGTNISAGELSAWLRSEGVNAVTGSGGIFKQKITLRIGDTGRSEESYSIFISGKKIGIVATSQAQLVLAVDALKSYILETQRKGRVVKYFRCGEISDWGGGRSRMRNDGMVDGTAGVVSVAEIESEAKKLHGNNKVIYFIMADESAWLMPDDAIRKLELGINLTTGTVYSYETISRMIEACRKYKVEFIPTLWVLKDMPYFKANVGHPNMSVEGLRYIKALIKDCVANTSITRICIGRNEEVPSRYVNDLTEYIKSLDIEPVILD